MLHLGSLKTIQKSIVLEFVSLYRIYDHFSDIENIVHSLQICYKLLYLT